MRTKQEEIKINRENCKKYREKHLNKDKKFVSVRFSMEEGTEIKEFVKKTGIPMRKIIEIGTETMWGEIN